MDFVEEAQKKLLRIRTFQDDVARARLQSNDPSLEPPPKTPLPQVLQTPVVEAVHVTPPVALTIAPQKQTAPSSLSQIHALSPIHSPNTITAVRATPEASKLKPRTQVPPLQEKLAHQISATDIAQVAKTHQNSILSDDGEMHSEYSLGGGNIIRDTKHKRFRLFPAMLQATLGWFSETKKAYVTATQGPTHTVAKVETRLATVQKALQQEKQAPKDDFQYVASHLKTIERKPVSTSVIIKAKSELPLPTWSHVVEQEPIATSEDIAPELIPAVTEVQHPEIIPESQEVTLQVPEVFVEHEMPKVVAPKLSPYVPPREVEVPSYVPQIPTYQKNQFQNAEPQTSPKTTSRYYLIFASVILMATTFGVGVSYYFFGRGTNTAQIRTEVVYEIPQLFTSQEKTAVLLPPDRFTFLGVLADDLKKNKNTVQLYPVLEQKGGTSIPADANSILTTLSPRTPGSFTRGIREISFGGVNQQPFIVLKTKSFDTAFAGMLAWEQTLSVDLSPLFGDPVTESFDSTVRTSTQTRDAFFKDIITSNKSARLLVDGNGDDRIVYAFIDQNTLVITTTRAALESIIPLVK